MVWYHSQYTEYEVSIDSKVVCLWFTKSSVSAAELNLKLKPQANDIKISLNFTYVAISPLIDRIWSLNWLWGHFLIFH
jgi:hypothetical protein